MPAIESSKQLFLSAGLPLLKAEFSAELPFIAAGLAGRGSECFGFDDEISRDHDFVPGFILWINDASDREFGFRLLRAYSQMQKLFPENSSASSILGDSERGVILISDFFRRHLGFPGEPECWQQWLYTPEYAFAEVVNGEIFFDGSGEISAIRHAILHNMPEDVRIKKLSARAIAMAQSGQYNFARCLKHREPGAAMLALAEFVRNTISMVFLLNRRFAPYYKWQFRALRQLPRLPFLADMLEKLLRCDLSDQEKSHLIEEISSHIAAELADQQLCSTTDCYLESHALELTRSIRNREIRALHPMEG